MYQYSRYRPWGSYRLHRVLLVLVFTNFHISFTLIDNCPVSAFQRSAKWTPPNPFHLHKNWSFEICLKIFGGVHLWDPWKRKMSKHHCFWCVVKTNMSAVFSEIHVFVSTGLCARALARVCVCVTRVANAITRVYVTKKHVPGAFSTSICVLKCLSALF